MPVATNKQREAARLLSNMQRKTQGDRWGEERRDNAMPVFTLGDFVGQARHEIERFKANHVEVEGHSATSHGRLVYKSDFRMTFAEWWALFTERHVHLDLVRLAEIGRAAQTRESNRPRPSKEKPQP